MSWDDKITWDRFLVVWRTFAGGVNLHKIWCFETGPVGWPIWHVIQRHWASRSEIWSQEAWESPERLDNSIFWQMNAEIQTSCTSQSETHNWQVGWGKGGQAGPKPSSLWILNLSFAHHLNLKSNTFISKHIAYGSYHCKSWKQRKQRKLDYKSIKYQLSRLGMAFKEILWVIRNSSKIDASLVIWLIL